VLVVTHDVEAAKAADRCCTLRDGHLDDAEHPAAAPLPAAR
jgi:ABC-type lipoprotein export system ATPase subunit